MEENHIDTAECHEDNQENLDPSKCILNNDTSPHETTMHNRDRSQQTNGQNLVLNVARHNIECEIGILGEDDAITRRES